MKTTLYCLSGLILGVLTALVCVEVVVGWMFPLFHGGAGRDNMTQGILGFVVLIFSAPIFGVAGCILGYRKAKKDAR